MFRNYSTYSALLLVAYIAVIAGVGYTVTRRAKERNSEEYFLAGRSLGWFTIGASVFVTTISWGWFLGLNDFGSTREGFTGWGGILGCVFALILGTLVMPKLSGGFPYTVQQVLVRRFNEMTGILLSTISILFNLVVRIPLALIGGGWILQFLFGWDMLSSAMLIIIVTGLYTIAGGFAAVVYTQVFQAFVVLAASAVLVVVGLWSDGNAVSPMVSRLSSLPDLTASTEAMAWPALVVSAFIIGIWFWCADQYVVQRLFGARSIQLARKGSMGAAWLLLLESVLLFGVATRSPGASLTVGLAGMPEAAAGIIALAFLALVMSTLASAFHSTATLFAIDFYRTLRPSAAESQVVLAGRLSATAVVVMAILIASISSLVGVGTVRWMQQVPADIAPPVSAVIVLGLTWKRVNGKGALWGLIIGEAAGLAHFLLSQSGRDATPWLPSDTLPVAGLLFVATALVAIVVSRLTESGAELASVGHVDGGVQVKKL